MKKLLSAILIFTVCLTAVGCSVIDELTAKIFPTEITDEEISLQQQEFINIGYSNSYDEDEIQLILSLDELNAWKNPYEEYSSHILYGTLNEDEKLVYKALEYALVNSYLRTFIDYRIEVNTSRIEEIVELLSLDNPLLEQNVIYTAYNNVAFYDYQYSDTRTVEVLHRSNTVRVSNFTRQHWNQKMLALDIAKDFISTLPKDCSEIEKAEIIYRHIAENVTYIPYENEYGHYKGALEHFLYDTFIVKESHCDGFTNALALLYQMADFEQVEKHNSITMGHTWNYVKIEGTWYNIEGTAKDYIPQGDTSMGSGLLFAFPDIYHEDYCEFKELYPEGKTSYYMNPDGATESCDSDDFFDIILDGFEKHNDEWAVVIVDDYDEDSAMRELQNLAQTYYDAMKYLKVDTADKRTLLLFVRADLMP